MKPVTRKRINQLARERRDIRKIIHIAIGLFGFVYAFVNWEVILFVWIIGTLCAWFLPARLESLETLLDKKEINLGYSPGMISYGLIMIIGTFLFQRSMMDAVILLSVVAFGDGFSALIGLNYSGTTIPYNKNKTIVGTLAFIFFGTIGACVLVFCFGAFAIHVPFEPKLGSIPIFRILIVMVVSAIVETIPFKISDNLTIGIAAIITLLLTAALHH